MKTRQRIYYVFVLILFSEFLANAQSDINWKNAEQIKEAIVIITERDVYCVEETLNFKAYNTSADSIKKFDWSKVLYVEIVTPDGRSVAKGKYKYGKNGCSGHLEIPASLFTGNYYLRAYTKWMRKIMF